MELWQSLDGEIQGAILTIVFSALAVLTGKTRNPLDNLLLSWFYKRYQEKKDG